MDGLNNYVGDERAGLIGLRSWGAELKICSFIQILYLLCAGVLYTGNSVVGMIIRASALEELTSYGTDNQLISQINIKLQQSHIQ